MDEIEERMARGRSRAARDRRTRRIRVGFLVAVVVAGALGVVIGRASERSTEEMAQEREEARLQGGEVSQEVNRVLLELWRMEEIEYQRNRDR